MYTGKYIALLEEENARLKKRNEELEERVAILKRFRFLLEQQRNKFKEYLNVLEKQQNSIDAEDSEALIKHSELEQQIVKNISNLQKVIVPMNKMYTAINNKLLVCKNDIIMINN